ncbi:MAG: GreA/GreB family elongation factor [Proteobacteria bacterium]|nr:GreA/GreB family elongation factor [Pseudomonadota bacterium]
MSRAFVKEPDGDQVSDDQPEWPISEHTNFVTVYGLQQLQARRELRLKQQDVLNRDKDSMSSKVELAQVGRELRYLTARISTTKVVLIPQDKTIVKIGASVNIIDDESREYQFQIVGEDEADVKLGKISWVSPLASALLDRALGEEVLWKRPSGDLIVEIDKIHY